MSQDNITATVATTELSRVIAALDQRHLEREQRLRRLRCNSACIGLLLFALGIYFDFHLPRLFWQKFLVVCIVNGLPVGFIFGERLAEKVDRKEVELALELTSFDVPAIVWALLPKLGSLSGPSYPTISDALIRLLGRSDEWQSGEWTDEQRLILQNAANWLADGDTLPDPDLAEAVRRALTPEINDGRAKAALPAARAIPRWRRAS